jgi:hypothetical protein
MPDTLADFPYVIVRLGCAKCFRHGEYRLANLAERYGSRIRLGELLQFLVGECRLWSRAKDWKNQICGARYIDLDSPRPPDLPAAMRAFKVLDGGRS